MGGEGPPEKPACQLSHKKKQGNNKPPNLQKTKSLHWGNQKKKMSMNGLASDVAVIPTGTTVARPQVGRVRYPKNAGNWGRDKGQGGTGDGNVWNGPVKEKLSKGFRSKEGGPRKKKER